MNNLFHNNDRWQNQDCCHNQCCPPIIINCTGATGPQGEVGPRGATGSTGPRGPLGNTGATGSTGSTGPQGIPGPKGDTGSIGPIGPQGIPGPKGDTGSTPPIKLGQKHHSNITSLIFQKSFPIFQGLNKFFIFIFKCKLNFYVLIFINIYDFNQICKDTSI